MTQGVRKLRIHDFTVLEGNREGARGGRMRFVHAEADDAHDDHCEDVEPCHLDPLAEGRATVVVAGLFVEQLALGTCAVGFLCAAVGVARVAGMGGGWISCGCSGSVGVVDDRWRAAAEETHGGGIGV